MVDLASDMVGQLHQRGAISGEQEQAARHWQQLRAAYICELPDVAGFKSCLAGSVPGFDDGDGDPQVIAEYRRMERRFTRAQRIQILQVCEEDQKPGSIEILRAALDVVAGR